MRRISLFLFVLVAAVALAVPPAAASDLTEEQLAGVLAGIHFFGGEEVPGYQEIQMVDGVDADSGLPRLVWVSHGVLDCGPPTSYPSLRAASFLRTVSPGDESFGNGIDKTHVWILEFEGDISRIAEGIAEVGIALFDAGAPGLNDATFPFAPTSGATRTVAAVFGPQLPGGETGVYGVTNADNQLDVFGNPFYIGVAKLGNGNTALVIAGPFSPGFAAYVSGVGDVVQSEEELRTRLAGYATEQRPAVVDALTDDQIASVPDGGVSFVAPDDGGVADPPGDDGAGTDAGGGDDGTGSESGTPDSDTEETAQTDDTETNQDTGDTETPTDSGSGDTDEGGDSGGGIIGWIFGLIIALVVAIGAYLLRNTLFGRSKRRDEVPSEGEGGTPPPLPDPETDPPTGGTTGPTEPRGSHGDGPVIPAGDTPTPIPADPGAAPSCDWELWFKEGGGWHKLREVAPGNTPCCIYKVTLGSTRDLAPASGLRTDLPAGRIRTATATGSGTATSHSGGVSTGSRSDDATTVQEVLAALDPTGLPDGLERVEVAAIIDHDESTSVTVVLESNCDGATNRYTASGDTVASVGGQQRSDNTDRNSSTIELVTSGTVQADLVGDLSAMAIARHGIAADQHRLEPDGAVGADDREAQSATVTKDDTHWDSGFSTSASLMTGQLVPEENWPTTDEVGTVVEYAASHGVKLSGAVTKGACGPSCCGGPCLCDPSFSLEIREVDGTPKEELVVDGTVWTLERQSFDDDGVAGWEAY